MFARGKAARARDFADRPIDRSIVSLAKMQLRSREISLPATAALRLCSPLRALSGARTSERLPNQRLRGHKVMLATCIIITVLEFDCTVLRAGERGDCGGYAAARRCRTTWNHGRRMTTILRGGPILSYCSLLTRINTARDFERLSRARLFPPFSAPRYYTLGSLARARRNVRTVTFRIAFSASFFFSPLPFVVTSHR